ncbi:MAG: hypothetical protein JWP18_1995 [Solirubrobacterales bacterium]|jgi:hypothetical protein|nr:hypothetical protein [Solirubrobacterales bacterium]
MDAHLKALADVSLALGSAEAYLDEQAHLNAREELDRASEGLAALRAQWPEMSAGERKVVGSTAGPLRDRLDAGRARMPKLSAVTQVAPEPGEEDEEDGSDLGGDGPPPPVPEPPAAA